MTSPEPTGTGYTLLPYYRTGIATALRTPFSTGEDSRASTTLEVPVRNVPPDGAPAAAHHERHARVDLVVRGPADVAGLDPRQIIRRHPVPGAANAEPGDLALIEFDRPDLPWQFTPTAPKATGMLPPWLRLVVVPADQATLTPASDRLLAQLRCRDEELPPVAEAWAWAHAQVVGTDVAAGLAPANPGANLSRLLCPRRLDENTDWIAAVVPVFRAGADVGLHGQTEHRRLGYTEPDRDGWSTLPVYDHWSFRTGSDGDFATLAGRLRPPAKGQDIDVGIRHVDTANPGEPLDRLANDATGRSRGVRGALTAVGETATDGAAWPPKVTEDLRNILELANRQKFGTAAADDPVAGPPLYGGTHTARTTVADDAPPWFRAVNLDPADRLVAGLGTRVVQMDQEDLMAAAWTQVGGVTETNQGLRLAQFGRYISESLHRRLDKFTDSAKLSVTNPVAPRVLEPTGLTVDARIATSTLPRAAVGQLRRFAAPRGRIARFVPVTSETPTARVEATQRLLTDIGGDIRNWVVMPRNPDGITTLAGSTGPDDFMPEVTVSEEDLSHAAIPDLLTDPVVLERLFEQPTLFAELVPRLLSAVADRLLISLPTQDEIRADADLARAVVGIHAQLRDLAAIGERHQVTRWFVDDSLAPDGLHARLDDLTELSMLAMEVMPEAAPRHPGIELEGAFPSPFYTAENYRDEIGALIGSWDQPSVSLPALDSFAVTDLDLLATLDPGRTAPRRVLARLPDRAHWPTWLAPDWFDDSRIEPVMAGPTIRHAMYEALYRHDPEWLMPGIAALRPANLVTVLQTNSRFVEAFLIGVNTEFARELVWRGFPTDGRATSFRSFWTTESELRQNLHDFDESDLGEHLQRNLGKALVVVVRGDVVRHYPNLLAHLMIQTDDLELPASFSATGVTALFRLRLDPDILLLGFQLPPVLGGAAEPIDRLQNPAPGTLGGWWFALSEHAGEPRFGLLDAPLAGSGQLSWNDVNLTNGRFLVAEIPGLAPETVPHAAQFGAMLFRHPERAAFAAARILTAAKTGGR